MNCNRDLSLASPSWTPQSTTRSHLGAASSQLGISLPSAVSRHPYHSAYFQARDDLRTSILFPRMVCSPLLFLVSSPLTRSMLRLFPRRRARRLLPQPKNRGEGIIRSRRSVRMPYGSFYCSLMRRAGRLEGGFQEETGRRI